jgi:hypothetical protein
MRGLSEIEKREVILSALKERERSWFAVCLQEVGQKEEEESECDGITMWLAKGRPTKNGKGGDRFGLGMLLHKDGMQAWQDGGCKRKMNYPSQRVMDCRFLVADCAGHDIGIHLVNAHAPIGRASSNEWKDFFADLDLSIASANPTDVIVLGGDLNSSIGIDAASKQLLSKHTSAPLCGPYGIAHQNESGRRLLLWMATQQMVAVSTYFKKKRYATWTGMDKNKKPFQRDHFLVLGKDAHHVSDCGFTGDLGDSDHRAIKCTLRIKSRLTKQKVKSERSKLAMKDYSDLVGEDEEAAAVEAELDCMPSPNSAETSSAWHHDTLVKAVLKVSSELEDRVQVADPGRWVDAADSLKPLVDGRNAVRALLMITPRSRPLRRRLEAFQDLAQGIPPSVRAHHVQAQPVLHPPQPRQDEHLAQLTRHPDHRDLHHTTTAAVAWACVADGTRAKAAPTEETSGLARAHLWTHSGAYDTSS